MIFKDEFEFRSASNVTCTVREEDENEDEDEDENEDVDEHDHHLHDEPGPATAVELGSKTKPSHTLWRVSSAIRWPTTAYMMAMPACTLPRVIAALHTLQYCMCTPDQRSAPTALSSSSSSICNDVGDDHIF
jgi:hypothetical protein